MKKCSKCNNKKTLDKFYIKKSSKDGLDTCCKQCQNKYTKSHYSRYKQYYVDKARKNKMIARKRIYDFLTDFCRRHPCKCGESDFTVLDFNHKRRSLKSHNISSLMAAGVGMELLKKELKKCEVMCSNCHRRHTAKQMKWYKEFK